jgi:hypothetical protein
MFAPCWLIAGELVRSYYDGLGRVWREEKPGETSAGPVRLADAASSAYCSAARPRKFWPTATPRFWS